jgi:Ser/Thr protein kinase RdoA (MazF antagonist)/AraC-like DNA-binding protein
MQTVDSIKSSLEYIEQNLKTTITADELAFMTGYSVWHFRRLFADATGTPVAGYIRKRRIDRALTEISQGRKAADVVSEYGFDTYAGFYKAFVRMYGCSPKKYLSLRGKHPPIEYGGEQVLTEHELREILANWDIPRNLPRRGHYIMDGTKASDSEWFLGDSHILRCWERSRALKTLRVEKALAAQGFGPAAPVMTKSGANYLDGEYIFALTEKTPGAPLDKADRFGEKRRGFGFKYGAGIARLHRALSVVENDITPDETNLLKQITGWALPAVKARNERHGMGLTDDFFEDYITEFGAVFGKLPKQLIHRDPNPSNILFDGGEVSGFTSFDLSERNLRLWDPCYCATGILSEQRSVDNIYQKWPDILEGILRGYDSVNPLTAEEKQAIFHVICSIQMVFAAWSETQNGAEFKELAKTNRNMLRFIADQKERITKIAG